ncbi:MAG: damage-inducible protein DinB [Hyphomicrobiales bacterium]|nr:damage-inducible protein DinB [Hyphomicrobiales bacterium]
MIDTTYAAMMARYNSWQNRSLYGCAAGLSDAERKVDRGAFFGSIHATLNHILWADQMWLSRFAGTPQPAVGASDSVRMFAQFEALAQARTAMDATIEDWAGRLDPAWLAGDLTWFSGILKRDMSKPKALLIVHFFNHQTHHRGQAHAMLTAAGCKPDDTDLMLMP